MADSRPSAMHIWCECIRGPGAFNPNQGGTERTSCARLIGLGPFVYRLLLRSLEAVYVQRLECPNVREEWTRQRG